MTPAEAWDLAVWLDCSDQRRPDEKCSIFLPHQSPLGTFRGQVRQPTGEWPAVFLCLRHGRSCVRSADSIRLDVEVLAPHQPVHSLWRIECRCGHNSCGAARTIYIGRMQNWEKIVQVILESRPTVPCGDHDLTWREDLMRGVEFAHDSPLR